MIDPVADMELFEAELLDWYEELELNYNPDFGKSTFAGWHVRYSDSTTQSMYDGWKLKNRHIRNLAKQ